MLSINQLDTQLLLRLAINLLVLAIFLFWIYARKKADAHHKAVFFLFGTGVFLVTRLLHNVDMTMGFAFGLFAVFSMLRYRTESLSVRDMTYLFIVIAISLISAVSMLSMVELVIIHSGICILSVLLEARSTSSVVQSKVLTYEKIENIKPQHYKQLLADLQTRTGLAVERAVVEDIDFLKDTAQIKIFYTPDCNQDRPAS